MNQLFNFNGNNVRTIVRNGEPWFVLKDVCDVLEIGNPSQLKTRLDDGVISNEGIHDSLGRMQTAVIVNEDGLYDVILESRKPEAKAFRKWVTSEVIPSIRKHGAYMTPETIEKTLTDPDFIISIASRLKQANEEKHKLEAQIEYDRPKVLFADSLAVSKDSILVADLAKLLKQNGVDVGEKRLFDWMRNEGYLIKGGSERNMPTQRSMNLGIMEVKVGYRGSSDGTTKITRTPKITGKGQVYFINKFIKGMTA